MVKLIVRILVEWNIVTSATETKIYVQISVQQRCSRKCFKKRNKDHMQIAAQRVRVDQWMISRILKHKTTRQTYVIITITLGTTWDQKSNVGYALSGRIDNS